MAEITLTKGHVTRVDDEDYDYLSSFSWYYAHGYAQRTGVHKGVRYSVRMHRAILQAPSTLEVDHINGDKLDNRKANLRLVTRRQQMQNLHGARSDSRTGVRGVHRTDSGRYQARIWLDGEGLYLGTFDTVEAANEAAREARAEHMSHAPEVEVSR